MAVNQEVMISISILKLYESSEIGKSYTLQSNPYASQTPFKADSMQIRLIEYPDFCVNCVKRQYRPGFGQELESIDVYDFGNGIFQVVLKLLKGSRGSQSAVDDFYSFILNKPVCNIGNN